MASGLSSFDKEGMPGSVPGPRRGWLELVRDGQTVACRTTLSSASSRPPLFIRAEFYPQLFDTGDGEVAQSCFLRLCGIWQRPAMAGGIGQSLKAAGKTQLASRSATSSKAADSLKSTSLCYGSQCPQGRWLSLVEYQPWPAFGDDLPLLNCQTTSPR